MTYRQYKKYIKQLVNWWEFDDYIFMKNRKIKKDCKEIAAKLKSKRQLKRKLEEI